MEDTELIECILERFGFEEEKIGAAIEALIGESQPAPCDEEAWLTPKQLCERFNISNTTLWRLGPEVPHVCIGKRQRFKVSEVEKFLTKRV
jgi:hypothetical protein